MSLLFSGPAWKLSAGATVLLNIDFQNDFLHENGAYAQAGVDISHMRRVIEPTTRLVAECRRRGVPIIWTTHGTRGSIDAGPFFELRPFLRDGGLRIGSWGFQIYESLTPQEDDWIVVKHRHSAFFQTDLDLILRGLKADTVLMTGVLTNQCVGATCKDALYRNYRPIVVEECTGTAFPHLHDATIELIRVGWGQVNSLEETLSEFEQRFRPTE